MTHDRYFRKNMEDKEIARSLIEMAWPRQATELFQLDKIESDKEAYLNNKGEQIISDVVFSVPLEEGETYVSVLIEHKSMGALGKKDNILLQVRTQELSVMTKKHRDTGRCPLVYIMGLYLT